MIKVTLNSNENWLVEETADNIDAIVTITSAQETNMPKYTVQQEMVVGDNGKVFPLSVLDKHRMMADAGQIGRRYWDDKWGCWSFEVVTVAPGVDVTGFIETIV